MKDLGSSPLRWPHDVFVGRERELAEIELRLAEASVGRGCLCLISGEAGIGKTRLAEETEARAARRGFRVFWGRAWEGEGAPAFWPWVQVLRGCVRHGSRDQLARQPPSRLAHVAELVPELRESIRDVPVATTAPDSEEARFARFDAITSFLEELSRERPLLLILDDLQWADRSSLHLLEIFAQGLSGAPALVLGTIREPEASTGFDPDLAAKLFRLGHSLPLSGLPVTDLLGFIEKTGTVKSPDPFAAELREATNGNPFFVVEVLRLLAAELEDHPVDLAPGKPLPLPGSVRAAIAKRLARLPETTCSILKVAAVAGRALDLAVLEQVCARPALEILTEIVPALEAGILVQRAEEGVTKYVFSHGLVRETLYEDSKPAERAELHGRIGEAIEQLRAGRLEAYVAELAHHFSEAVAAGAPADKAVDYSKRAGRRARALLAYEESVRHFRRALGLLDRHGSEDTRTRCECLIALGEVLWIYPADIRGEQEAETLAEDLCREAARLAETLGDADLVARAALALGSPYSSMTPPGIVDRELIRLLDAALTMLPDEDSPIRARVMTRLAVALRYAGDSERSLRLARDGLAMGRRSCAPGTLVDVLGRAHLVTWGCNDLEERLKRAEEIIDLAESVDDWRFAILGRMWRMSHALEAGRVDLARQELSIIEERARRGRLATYEQLVSVFNNSLAILEGRFEDARSVIDGFVGEAIRMNRLFERPVSPMLRSWWRIQRFTLSRETGQLEDAAATVERATAENPSNPLWKAALALIRAETGRTTEARDLLEDVARGRFRDVRRDQRWHFIMGCLSETVVLLEDREAAQAVYELLEPFADRCAVNYTVWCGGSVARWLGKLATLLGRSQEAERHFEVALEMNRRMDAKPSVARTAHDYASMLLGRKDAADAARAEALLRESAALAGQLQMAGLLAQVEGALAETDGVSDDAAGASATSDPAVAVLRREGDFWTIGWQGKVFRLRDLKGLGYIQRLVGEPGRELHCVDLLGDESVVDLGDAGETLDAQAKAAYGRRLEALQDELAEAEGNDDIGRASRAREEMEILGRELSSALGLGGRDRRAARNFERARVRSTRSIRDAIARIRKHDPALGRHLSTAIRTGAFCSYSPDPTSPVIWRF